MADALSTTPKATTPKGPLGRGRSAGLVILLSIVTFGIWTLVWSYQNGEEIKTYRREGLGGLVYLILTLLIYPVTMFLLADEVEKLYTDEGVEAPISVLWGLWFLLPIVGMFVWYIHIQNCINRYWESKGGAAPSGV